MWDSMFRIFTELSSRPGLARLTGAFAKSPISRRLIPKFAALYRIPQDEAELPIGQYATLNEFFTRRLKGGARIIDEADDTVVSPVDGTVVYAGTITAEQMFIVKGQTYSVSELLADSPHAVRYNGGFAAVIYLSPSNYHRIHSPVEGTVIEFDRVPGAVYPVNDRGMRLMPKVLSRNARLITYIQHEHGLLALVKVGAMNVGSIQFTADDDRPPSEIGKGEELAYFEFGSTVVLLMEKGGFVPDESLQPGSALLMGERIGAYGR